MNLKRSNNPNNSSYPTQLDTSYIFIVVFYLFLLAMFLINTLVFKLPANASEVLLRDIPPAELKKADLFYPEKNPFIYKELPITIHMSPSMSVTTVNGATMSLTATGSLSITPSNNVEYTVEPTTSNEATPTATAEESVSPAISDTTVVPSSGVSPSTSGGGGDSTVTPTLTPTPETT